MSAHVMLWIRSERRGGAFLRSTASPPVPYFARRSSTTRTVPQQLRDLDHSTSCSANVFSRPPRCFLLSANTLALMILVNDNKPPSEQDMHMAGPSSSSAFPPPPSFEESAEHTLVELGQSEESEALRLLPGGEDAPPDFSPYEAECSIHSGGTVVSHDPHLNTDGLHASQFLPSIPADISVIGEALYRFLISQAMSPPTYVLRCKGEHSETRTRYVQRHGADGRSKTHTETYTETVTDFDFSIDVGQHIISGPTHWSIADNEPAYRGRMFQQVDTVLDGRVKAAYRARKAASAWKKERASKGLPPWVGFGFSGGLEATDEIHHMGVLKSSRTLRQWADDYCASDKYIKEFVYERVRSL
jgi:hypothetical protein